MGCTMCVPKAEAINPSVYFPDGLPEDIVHLTPDSLPELIKEFCDGLASSFEGEPTTSWGYDGETKEVTAERTAFFRWSMQFCFVQYSRHGGCFALKDSEGAMVAFAITVPPSSRALHKPGMCETMYILNQCESMPAALQTGDSAVRMQLIENTMHKAHDIHGADKHFYINCFGTKPDTQGKGYGKKLVQYLTAAADHNKLPTYLECSGAQNERFWGKNGFEVKERYPMTYITTKYGEKKEMAFEPDGLAGIAACVRPPST